MSLSHLLHAWELLKHRLWSGSVLGLIIGLERQHVPLMSVLYSLSHSEGELVTLQRDGIIYKVVEVSSFPYELRQHELYFLPLIVWALAVSRIAMFLIDIPNSPPRPERRPQRTDTRLSRLQLLAEQAEQLCRQLRQC